MERPVPAGEQNKSDAAKPAMSLGKLRHDIRNYLNAIKLSTALLQRAQGNTELVEESLKEIDRSADGINELVSRHLSNDEAFNLMRKDKSL